MAICADCQEAYHTDCITPPLPIKTNTNWFCASCLTEGEDFGFPDGPDLHLHEFEQKAMKFKTQWLSGKMDGKGHVDEDAIEQDFWRLAQDPFEHVEVLYGADIHSSQFGRYVHLYIYRIPRSSDLLHKTCFLCCSNTFVPIFISYLADFLQ
jgi:hypothetical protein